MSLFQKYPENVEAERSPTGWAITVENGNVLYLSDFTFKRTYYPVGKDKCAYCKHRRRHSMDIAVCDRHGMCLFTWREDEEDE